MRRHEYLGCQQFEVDLNQQLDCFICFLQHAAAVLLEPLGM